MLESEQPFALGLWVVAESNAQTGGGELNPVLREIVACRHNTGIYMCVYCAEISTDLPCGANRAGSKECSTCCKPPTVSSSQWRWQLRSRMRSAVNVVDGGRSWCRIFLQGGCDIKRRVDGAGVRARSKPKRLQQHALRMPA
eukprot:3220064-Rhodomonas_salina.1